MEPTKVYRLNPGDFENIGWAIGQSKDLIDAVVNMVYHGNPPDSYKEFVKHMYEFTEQVMEDARKQSE